MNRKSWKAWLSDLFLTNEGGPSRRRRHRFRPQIGVLEDRIVPTTTGQEVEPNNTSADADFIDNTVGQDDRFGTVGGASSDFFYFTAQAGDRVVITVTSDDGTFDPAFELFRPNGTSFNFFDGGNSGDDEVFFFDLDASGDWDIEVTSADGVSGDYTVIVDRPGTLQFDPTSLTISETGGTAFLTVKRTGGSDGTVSVNYARSGGTAAPGTDFILNPGTVTFAQGVTSAIIPVTILTDKILEGTQTVRVTLSNPTNEAKLGTQTTATINITNVTPPTVATSVQVKKKRGRSQVLVFDNNGKLRKKVTPFGSFTGKVTAKLKDLNGDGLLDLVAKATVNGLVKKKKYFSV